MSTIKTAIIVDTDEYVCGKISHWFQSIGWQTIIFHDGWDVWNQLQEMLPVLPGCVVAEVTIPGMNAYDLARNCATNFQLKDVNLIYYSAKDSEFDHYWACTGSRVLAYVGKTDGRVTIQSQKQRYVGDEPPESIKQLVDEFHSVAEDQELNSETIQQLVDYSFTMLTKVLHDLLVVDDRYKLAIDDRYEVTNE
jgi:CheY-like chemotaxis protein